MQSMIKWEKIKNGYSGFECLAYKFVEMNFPNPKWIQTSATHDGNKDAVAIFFGYKENEISNEKWWMEAKYSTTTNVLSRYRLDATIVSAILQKNVSKVIFVTNICVNTKTINDIRNALYNSIHCNDVLFYTKYSLEYWLAKNIDIYKDFFEISIDTFTQYIQYPSLFVMEEIEYYSEVSSVLSFKEPLRELHMKEKYYGYFKIFSDTNRKVSFKPHEKMKGISILDKNEIQLYFGENSIKFAFFIDEYEYMVNGNIYPPSFLLDNIEITSTKYIIPIRKNKPMFELHSQKNIIEDLNNKYKQFTAFKNYSFNFIEGISGSGKSYILESFVKESVSASQEVFYAEFTTSPQNNNEILIYLILFILFPFVNPGDIDCNYLNGIQDNFVGNAILELVESKNDFDIIAKIMFSYHINDRIFPLKTSIFNRIIVLDDLQKLTKYEANFLSVIIADMQRHNLPVFAVFSSQPSYYMQQSYKNLLEHCIINHYKYAIGLNDIFRALSVVRKKDFYLNQELSYSMEFNVVEIFLFAKYILDNEIIANNIHDFIKICKIFQRTPTLELYILKQFENLFHIYPQSRKICDSIYWSSEPQNACLYYDYINELNILLSNGLIKYNFDSFLVPVHDLYKFYYCKHFKPTFFNASEYNENSVELIKYRMLHCLDCNCLLKETNKIIDLMNNQKFYSVSYILEDIFESSNKERLRNILDKVTYYKLYFAYALSATQQSTHKTGYDIFLELSEEIKNISIPEILELSINIDWDLAIGDFERLKFKQAFKKLKNIIISLKKLIKINNNTDDLYQYSKYYDVLMLDTLIRANKDEPLVNSLYFQRLSIMESHGFLYRSKSFQVRFALTLCTKNMYECLELLQTCATYFQKEYGLEDKYYLWANYHFYYFSMVYHKQPELIFDVIKFHNKIRKNFYLNYRQRINGIASYYYYTGDITNGNKFLLLESSFNNELPKRQIAFHYETVALHEILVHNKKEAIQALQKAISMFDELPSYQKVAIHNLEIINNSSSIPLIEYWFGYSMDADIYYIDSRCSW